MPSVTLAKKLEKSVRTKAWMTYLLNETDSINAHQLALLFLKKSDMDTEVKAGSKWSEYDAGKSSPSPNTLLRVDTKVPAPSMFMRTALQSPFYSLQYGPNSTRYTIYSVKQDLVFHIVFFG